MLFGQKQPQPVPETEKEQVDVKFQEEETVPAETANKYPSQGKAVVEFHDGNIVDFLSAAVDHLSGLNEQLDLAIKKAEQLKSILG